jgi:hypothetical protein
MCFACDMEAMWFAVMEARANAAANETAPLPDEPATLLAPIPPGEPDALLPPPERGRVGGGAAGGLREERGNGRRDESEDPHPNPPPEEGGGGARSVGERSAPSRRFACEETSAE